MTTRAKLVLLGLPATAAAALLVAPTVVIIGASLSAAPITAFPPKGVSLHWYGQAWDLFSHAFRLSLTLGIATALLAIPLAFPAALAISRTRFRGRGLIQLFLVSPLFVPAILIGVALLDVFVSIGLEASFVALLLTHLLLTLPYAIRTVTVSLAGIDKQLEEAAVTLGATPLRRLLHVTVPLASSGLIAGGLFAFVVSLGELNASVFVAGPGTTTLPIEVFSELQWNSTPAIAAVSVAQMLLTLTAALVIDRAFGLNKALNVG